ncbi:hypothetical protein GBAR_LOCUS2939 [Geodia barretti]|uniref:Uncharacterized protein n=1 Tax=Geodia barretti TaxID=519541 RepID=A0AA35R1C7_GEOBA|nr:hypothetical protein GBAR_LOCUS2939 [Geodia barretti]
MTTAHHQPLNLPQPKLPSIPPSTKKRRQGEDLQKSLIPIKSQLLKETLRPLQLHPSDQATESHGEEHSMSNGTAVTTSSQALVYAELNLHTKKSAAPPPKPPRPPDISYPQPDEEQPVAYSTVNSNPYSTPRTPSQPANAGEATYYTTVITTN